MPDKKKRNADSSEENLRESRGREDVEARVDDEDVDELDTLAAEDDVDDEETDGDEDEDEDEEEEDDEEINARGGQQGMRQDGQRGTQDRAEEIATSRNAKQGR